jgi:hypothetical protein
MIRLLAYHLPPPPVSKLSLFLCLPVCRRSCLLLTDGRGQCCGSGIRYVYPGSSIPDPNFSIPDPRSKRFRIRMRIKEYTVSSFTLKTVSKISEKLCGMFISDPGAGFSSIPDPRSRGQNSTGSRIPDPDPQHWEGWGKGWARNKIIRARESLAIINHSILSG